MDTVSEKNIQVVIILDVAKFRLYKPVQTVSPEETITRDFLKLDFLIFRMDTVSEKSIQEVTKVVSLE